MKLRQEQHRLTFVKGQEVNALKIRSSSYLLDRLPHRLSHRLNGWMNDDELFLDILIPYEVVKEYKNKS